MKPHLLVCLAASAGLFAGCASTSSSTAAAPAASTAPAPSATPAPGTRVVKSRDGRFEGEMVGTPAPGSKFAKLQIGMEMNEVFSLIGAGTNMTSNETGKRWIPFYFGNDARRVQVSYANEGCLTFTGGNIYGAGGNELIRIAVDPKGICGE